LNHWRLLKGFACGLLLGDASDATAVGCHCG
jgi:hypothetical protein